MAKTIWKYTLAAQKRQDVAMPKGAQILSVGLQGSKWTIWAMVDPEVTTVETRTIESYGTGHDIDKPERLRFLGTTIDTDGSALVFHHFERVQ